MAGQSFSVSGLKCEGCVETITAALTALEPVHAVNVDLDPNGASTVHISTDAELSREQVQAALKGEGDFTVVAG